jgi:hypothetical protein
MLRIIIRSSNVEGRESHCSPYFCGTQGFANGHITIRECIHKFPDWPPRARIANVAVVSLFFESV